MHELSITRNIVAIVAEHARGARVRRVRLEIGPLSAVMPDAVRFCFEVVAAGTAIEGATLHIDATPGEASCRACGAEFPLRSLLDACACGSRDLRRSGGDALMIREIETEEVSACA